MSDDTNDKIVVTPDIDKDNNEEELSNDQNPVEKTMDIGKKNNEEELPNDQNPVEKTTDNDEQKDLSPNVIKISWGSVDVKDFGEFKDVKLYPGGKQ